MEALALRRNLAGHGYDGFPLTAEDHSVLSVFGEILSFEPRKASWTEDFVIREIDLTSGTEKQAWDTQLWEESCLLKSTSGIVRSADAYYVVYELRAR